MATSTESKFAVKKGGKKDERYSMIRELMRVGYLKTFRGIFKIIPKTTVSRDLGMNNMRFSNLINNVEMFVLKDIIRMASLFELEYEQLHKIIWEQYKQDQTESTQNRIKMNYDRDNK